ncbi:MAG: sulfite exporter TauE/SafE family protein [Halobacteriales archaeon]
MAPASPDLVVLLGIALVAFGGGIGIATVGPGGVFVTVALVAATAYGPGTIAGTMSAALFLGGLLGTAAYLRSGELRAREGRRIALVISVASGAGAFAGSQLNALFSPASFEPAVAGFVLLTGVLLWVRDRGVFEPIAAIDPTSTRGGVVLAGIGAGVGLPSGLFGVGGPVLAVPLLVLVGIPMLTAVGAAQLLSVFVAGSATSGYLLRGTVDPALLAAVAAPMLAGIGVGWRVAHRVESDRLRSLLALVLVGSGGVLLL